MLISAKLYSIKPQHTNLINLMQLLNQYFISFIYSLPKSSMNSTLQSSLPISPITGDELCKPSSDFQYNQMMQSFALSRTQKSDLVKQNNKIFDCEELDKKVQEYLNAKIENEKVGPEDQNHDQFCVCTDCVYARMLNKPSHTMFNLTMRTVYKNSYPKSLKKSSEDRQKMNKSQLVERFNGKNINDNESSISPNPKITLETIYSNNFYKDQEARNQKKRTSLKADDTIKFDGPFQNITSYSSKFPGVYGSNPYVKPVDKSYRDNFKIDARTSNSTTFKGQCASRTPLARSPDMLKTGFPMLVKQSSTKRQYVSPQNPQKYNQWVRNIEKRQKSPTDKLQFGSTYRSSFYGADILENAKYKKRLLRDTLTRLGRVN